MSPEIRYWSNRADEALPTHLSISAKGEAILTIESNRDNPGIPNIGVFRAQLQARELAPLVAALRTRDFINHPNPKSALPGEVIRRFSMKEEGHDEIMKYVSEGSAPTPAFVTAENLALGLVKWVRQHPVYALAMDAGPMPEQFGRGHYVQFKMTLVNPGSETIRIPHPETWPQEGAQFELVGIRSDLPAEQLRNHHQRFQPLTQQNIQDLQPSDVTPPRITLSLRARLAMTLGVVLDWPPGQYETKYSFLCATYDREDKQVCRGEIVSTRFNVKVTGSTKPGEV